MTGEYPSARRRSARRARGGRAEHGEHGEHAGAGDREYLAPGQDGDAGSSAAEPGPGRSALFGAAGIAAASSGWPGRAAAKRAPAAQAPAREDDPETRARQACLRLLTLAPRTRAQLADALARQGIPQEVAQDVLGRFTSAGLIDDAAFARAWVESRHYGRGLSGRALTAELRQRGVGDDQIKDAVDGLGPDAEAETARRLVARKLAATQGQPAEARTRRLAGMLARKGYPPGLAFRVIREALEAEGADAAVAGALLDAEAAAGDFEP